MNAAPTTMPHRTAYLARRFQKLLDDLTPYTAYRWTFTALTCLAYCLRVFTVQGWYIVTYALAIYLLNLFLAFLQPKFDPAMGLASPLDDDDDREAPGLPMKNDDEFRPFIRTLPEFKFWYAATRAFLISFFCTFFEIFDIPVFWPLLLVYFLILFGLTMRRQIKHMIKYRYIPFNLGKKKYTSVPTANTVKNSK
ncbi:hypothetical protein SeLEV6574_g01122 [Synchytrium endobioticum]|nr:hypothetical protein SeLEV6574_g01122 [Synchytrium endobioticum]